MASSFKSVHIDPDMLAMYFDGVLRADDDEAIAQHLAGCFSCTERARTVTAFASLWDQWTGALQSKSADEVAVLAAMSNTERDSKTDSETRQKARRWKNPKRSARPRHPWRGATFRIVVSETPAESSPIPGIRVSISMKRDASPQTNPPRVRGAVRTRGASAARQNSDLPPAVIQRFAEIHVDDLQEGETPPLIALIPLTPSPTASIEQVNAASGAVRFAGLAPGEYIVSIEPEEA